MTNGLINASSNFWYGNKGFKSAEEALKRGFGAGATRSGIKYLSETLGKSSRAGNGRNDARGYGKENGLSALGSRDPRMNCGSRNPFQKSLGYTSASGYRYRTVKSNTSRKNQFSLTGLLGAMAFGGVMEGLGSLAFFEAGKAVEALKRSGLSRADSRKTQIIRNKFPDDKQSGKSFRATVENGKINIENGIHEVDFIIDMDGNLHIGKGHSYLSEGQNVQAAGTMKVNSFGYIRNVTNESGHFQPTVSEALNYPQIFRDSGLNVDNAWIKISEFNTSMSNYILDKHVIYNSPIKYMPY